MTSRATRATVAAACLVASAAACRQILGIGDAPPSALADAAAETATEAGPACGIAYAGASCEACLEKSCCAQATACGGSQGCRALEECLGGCAGDPTCRARCVGEHLVVDPGEPPFDSCLATRCADPCGITCGGAAEFGPPDAAAGCERCLLGSACTPAVACAADPECLALPWCIEQAHAGDRLAACLAAHDAGIAEFNAYDEAARGQCPGQCMVGANWTCVGHITPPIQLNALTASQLTLTDYATQTRAAGVSVQVCAASLPPCTPEGDAGVTGTDGKLTVDIPANVTTGIGPSGYLKLTGGGIMPELYFWGYPLSEPVDVVRLGTLTTGEFTAAAEVAQAPALVPGRAHVALAASDCSYSFGTSVVFEVSPSDAQTRVLYAPGTPGSATAVSTDSTGIAFIVNVPAQPGTVTVTATAFGRTVAQASAFVLPDTVSLLGMLPQ